MSGACRHTEIPPRRVRGAERLLFKLGALDWRGSIERPILAARKRTLGEAAAAPPRFLVRVDEFPNYRAWDPAGRYGTESYRAFHEAMRWASLPYLLAVLPFVCADALDPACERLRPLAVEEVAMLGELEGDGVAFALHGRDHRTRDGSPRRRSELCGLSAAETTALLDEASGQLASAGVEARIFVPPYNRFDAAQLPLLGARFEVVCGGPESIGLLGLHSTPQWLAETVYLPSYPPFYGTAEQIMPAVADAIERRTGTWIPVTLHWEWEARDSYRSLARLAELIAPYAVSWEEFLVAVSRSRGASE
ncbi:MAG: DUF2334 domain-containing protein, partial [Solirubrobacteraceae bacterium]